MKKTKRYAVGGMSDEEGKDKIFAGSPAEDDGMRPGRNLALEPDVTPRPRPRPKTPRPRPRGTQEFPISVNAMESGANVMKRGQATRDGSDSSPLDKYNRDKETKATRDKRKMDLAVERVKAGVGYKKGGSVGSASKRADGCAQRGKTKGRVI